MKLVVAFAIPAALLYALYSYASTASTREQFASLICPGGGRPFVAITISPHPNADLANLVSAPMQITDAAELTRLRAWFTQAQRYTPNHDADFRYSVCEVKTADGETCEFLLMENSKHDYFLRLHSNVHEGWHLGTYKLPADFRLGAS